MFSLCKKPPVPIHTPSTPYEPVGASEGVTDTTYHFYTSSTDPDSDHLSYRVFVTSGDTTNWFPWKNSGDTFRFNVTFFTPDTYSIKVQVKDGDDSISGWSKPHVIAISEHPSPPNRPPNTPGKPIGFACASIGVPYWVVSEVSDPDYDPIRVRVDLGNGDTTDWSSQMVWGDYGYASIDFMTPGSYTLKMQAQDDSGAVSGWSDTINVTVGTDNFPGRVVGHANVGANSVVAHPDGSRVYAIGSGHLLTAVSTTNDSVVASVRLDQVYDYGRLAIRPDGQYLYASGGWGNRVWVVRTSDMTLVDSVLVDTFAFGIAVTPDGNHVYVSCGWPSGNVFVIRTSDNVVVDTVHACPCAWSMAPSPDGQYMYLASGSAVVIVRTSDNTVVGSVGIGQGLYSVAVLPDGKYLYAAANEEGKVCVVRTSDNTVVSTIATILGPLCLTALPNGQYVYLGHSGLIEGCNAAVIRTSDNTIVADISLEGGEAYGTATTLSDGSRVYFSGGEDADGLTAIGNGMSLAVKRGVSTQERSVPRLPTLRNPRPYDRIGRSPAYGSRPESPKPRVEPDGLPGFKGREGNALAPVRDAPTPAMR
jgi:DNA-binding beta-propeller fold protein YncE